MPPTSAIVVTIVDEGYFQKTFRFSPTTILKKVLDAYRKNVCGTCSNTALLDFWYETTKITDTHTASSLGIVDGDIIDVRLSVHCTRGACPLPSAQKIPNIHYLVAPSSPPSPRETQGAVTEQEEAPAPPNRITIMIKESNGFEMVIRTRVSTPFRKIFEGFASQVKREVSACRFLVDGERVRADQTPESLEMMDGDLVEVFYEVLGGEMRLLR